MNNNRILRLVLVAVDGRSQRKTFRFFVALVFCFQQIFSGLVPLSAYHGVEIVTVGSTPTPVKAIEDPLSGPRAVEHEPSTGDLLMEGSLSAPSASDEQEPLTPSDLTLIPNPGPAPSEEEVRTYYPDETLKSRHKTVKDGGDYYEYYPSGKKKSKLTRESGNFHYYEDSQSNRELFYIKPNGEVIERVKGSYPPSVEAPPDSDLTPKERAFAEADKNKDGKLTTAEVIEAIGGLRQALGTQKREFDFDRSGMVTVSDAAVLRALLMSVSDEDDTPPPSDSSLIPNPGPAPSEEEVRTYYPDETLKSRHKTVKDGGDYYEYYPSGKKKSKLTRESGNFHYYEDSQSNRELFYIKPNGEVIERVKGSYPPSVEPRTDDLEALRQTLLHQVDDVLSALSQEIKGLEQDLADFKSRAEAIVSRFQTEVDENRSALSGILAELQSIRDHNALSDQTRMDIDAYLNEVSGFLAPPSGMFEEIVANHIASLRNPSRITSALENAQKYQTILEDIRKQITASDVIEELRAITIPPRPDLLVPLPPVFIDPIKELRQRIEAGRTLLGDAKAEIGKDREFETKRHELLTQVDGILAALSQEISKLEQDIAEAEKRIEMEIGQMQIEVNKSLSTLMGIVSELESLRSHSALSDQTRSEIEAYLNQVADFLTPPDSFADAWQRYINRLRHDATLHKKALLANAQEYTKILEETRRQITAAGSMDELNAITIPPRPEVKPIIIPAVEIPDPRPNLDRNIAAGRQILDLAKKEIDESLPPNPPLPAPTGSLASMLINFDVLKRLPTSGPEWQHVFDFAKKSASNPQLSNQGDETNVIVLAKALVYARTGDENYRNQVRQAVMNAMETENGGRTLALGRELMAYIVAAGIVGLTAEDDAKFRTWLDGVRREELSGKTLISTHQDRPNNWGTMAGATRIAAAIYLGDTADLEKAVKVFKGYLGDRSQYAGFAYGDLSWQADPKNPVGINPKGATKNGINIDGVIPDDLRRGGGFKWPPGGTGYPYEAFQGVLAQAVLLYQAGHTDVWNWSDQAILRAFKWLNEVAKWRPSGDDVWQPFVVDYFYKTNFSAGITDNNPGKNMGFSGWLFGTQETQPEPPQPPAPDTTPPVISAGPTAKVSATGVTITWRTDEAADSQVEYGTSTNYGSLSALDPKKVTDHSVTLAMEKLSAETTYHYRVISRDTAGLHVHKSQDRHTTSSG